MARGHAALRDALCIQCDDLEQLAVAFKFLLTLLCCVHQQFEHLLPTLTLVALYCKIPTYRGRESDQCVELSQTSAFFVHFS
ncbi:hypothetical protein LMG28727_04079 [Paraburkholderia kirstenboschensis]|nr:hypothetical protein LMG28727_04079 [Paraburkholderia kirstenboschensis]